MDTLENNIHTRIKDRRMELGLSQMALARSLGVAQQTIVKWELSDALGGSRPRPFRLKKVAEQLKCTEEWLLTGNSATLSSQGNKPSRFVFIPRYKTGSLRVKQHYEIPSLTDEDDTFAYRIDLLQKMGLDPRSLRVVVVEDGSMKNADQCLVDFSQTDIQSGKAYAVETPLGPMVRRLYPRLDGQIVLRADNPAFPDEVAAPDTLDLVGRVVQFAGRDD